MNLLEEARIEINAVDKELALLFEKRMRASEKVATYTVTSEDGTATVR